MPLIHDNPWLVSQLLQAALDEEKKFSKKGQAAPAAPTQSPIAAGLEALLNNLRNQITPLREDPSKISTDVAGGADLASHHMDSMGDLVEWLVAHGTKVGGKVIVYPGDIARPSEDYGRYKIEPGTESIVPIQIPDRTVKGYWISLESLKQYLVSLQGDPKLKNNTIFQVQLLKLIQFSNSQLDMAINEQYQRPEQELPAETVMDAVAATFDEHGWPNGNVQLLYKDLASADDWRTWLATNKISAKQGGATVTPDNNTFDLCGALNALFARAQYKARGSRVPAALAYVKKLTEIAGQMQCNLTGQTQGQGQSQQGGAGASRLAMLRELRDILPFDSEVIDLDKIAKFVNKYAEFSNNAAETQTQQQVLGYIQLAKSLLKTPDEPIIISNANPDEFRLLTKTPNQDKQLALTLHDIITVASRMFQHFASVFEQGYGSAAASMLKQQVSSGGPAYSNTFVLNQLLQTLTGK